jgi:hypothetical protein
MSVLGILTCEILELEFAHLLGLDRQLARITILEDERSACLIKTLESTNSQNLQKIASLNEFNPVSKDETEVLVRVLELGLHNRKQTLQRGLVQAAQELGPNVDALLLGYGLCGNALEKPEELLSDAGVPVFIPMDEDHPIDDCVGLIIGGRKNYFGEQRKVAGTFFMIPGWTCHWRQMFEKEFGDLNLDLAKRLFANYERSLIISTPILSEDEMRRNSDAFNEMFGLRTETRKGTLSILNKTYNSAKAFLNTKTD